MGQPSETAIWSCRFPPLLRIHATLSAYHQVSVNVLVVLRREPRAHDEEYATRVACHRRVSTSRRLILGIVVPQFGTVCGNSDSHAEKFES